MGPAVPRPSSCPSTRPQPYRCRSMLWHRKDPFSHRSKSPAYRSSRMCSVCLTSTKRMVQYLSASRPEGFWPSGRPYCRNLPYLWYVNVRTGQRYPGPRCRRQLPAAVGVRRVQVAVVWRVNGVSLTRINLLVVITAGRLCRYGLGEGRKECDACMGCTNSY